MNFGVYINHVSLLALQKKRQKVATKYPIFAYCLHHFEDILVKADFPSCLSPRWLPLPPLQFRAICFLFYCYITKRVCRYFVITDHI